MNKNERNQRRYELERKSYVLAALFSLLLVGGGSFYNGKIGSGIIQLLTCFMLWFILLGWIVWIFSPFIAISEAKKHNELLMLKYNIEE